jgi:hypothetical protein
MEVAVAKPATLVSSEDQSLGDLIDFAVEMGLESRHEAR